MNPLLLILLLPILEIVGFIQVGDWIGAGPTIGLLALSALVGVVLVRHQGLASLTRAQTAAARGEAPIGSVLDGFCAVAAGILLIIPGFLTDLLGLVLLVPALRRGLGRWLLRRIGGSAQVFTAGTGGFRPGAAGLRTDPFQPGHGRTDRFQGTPGVIDGDYRDVTDTTRDDSARGPQGEADRTGADAADAGARRLSDSQWGKAPPDAEADQRR